MQDTAVLLFFPNEISSKGPQENFEFSMTAFNQTELRSDETIQNLYEKFKVKQLRVYLQTVVKRKCPVFTAVYTEY